MHTFAFVGEETVGSYVAERLASCGYSQVEEVASADIAFTCCLTTGMLEDAYFEDGGLIKAASPATVLVDLSPSTPSFARELSAVALVSDLVFVEAPLAVENPLAQGAFPFFDNLVCYVASEDDVSDEVFEVLSCLAASVVEAGEIGSAQLAKASHTIQMAAQVVGAVEAAALERSMRATAKSPESLSRDDRAVGEVALSVFAALAHDDFERGCAIEYLLSDVVAATSAADDVDLILPQLEAAMHLLELMAVIGGADLGPAALALLYREEAESAAHGLDWTRAEGLYDTRLAQGDDCDCADDDFGFSGGFSGYSEN